ncbi:hypothetical protein ACFL27_02785 [candidate division CSSED10-310 bacterium]|uniref:Uncharacterized protein n=1 Tax=candidate division CSSED10-310 bacterium TaxID=2855610 RepID=A0ABV6YSE6_UNCC1
MKMSGDVRVKTDVKHKELYNDMKNLAVGDMHELFFICACIGYLAGEQKALGTKGDDRFWSKTITPEEYTCYYAMILDRTDIDLMAIQDDKVVMQEIEKYANAGMQILIDDLLVDYFPQKNTLKIEKSQVSRELPKALLGYIFEKIQ